MSELEELRKQNEFLRKQNEALLSLVKRANKAFGTAVEKYGNGRATEKRRIPSQSDSEAVEALWAVTPPKGRDRSSKAKLEAAIRGVPRKSKVSIAKMVSALKAWSESEDWTKEGGQYVTAIDRWVRDRKWENLPEKKRARRAQHGITSV